MIGKNIESIQETMKHLSASKTLLHIRDQMTARHATPRCYSMRPTYIHSLHHAASSTQATTKAAQKQIGGPTSKKDTLWQYVHGT